MSRQFFVASNAYVQLWIPLPPAWPRFRTKSEAVSSLPIPPVVNSVIWSANLTRGLTTGGIGRDDTASDFVRNRGHAGGSGIQSCTYAFDATKNCRLIAVFRHHRV